MGECLYVSQSVQINSTRRRTESFEACCQWALRNVHINSGTVSQAALGKILRNGVERIIYGLSGAHRYHLELDLKTVGHIASNDLCSCPPTVVKSHVSAFLSQGHL